MVYNVLIIGFGSAGFRHAKIFNSLKCKVYIFSKRKSASFSNLTNLSKIFDYKFNLILISNETNLHYQTLKKVNKYLLKNSKTICLVEKPLFHRYYKFEFYKKNIYVAYNLRFHPLIIKLKKFLDRNKIYHVSLRCYSYLPNWKKINYQKSYSAQKNKGGGVQNDLSHEIDLIYYLFGEIRTSKTILKKISDLNISSKDIMMMIGETKKNIHFSLNLTYFSKIPERTIIVDGKNFNAHLDFLNNNLIIINKTKRYKISSNTDFMKSSFLNMNKNIISRNMDNLCNFNTGLKIVKLLDEL